MKTILFLKAVDKRDTHTVDMFGTHLETHTRKDGVVQQYRVGRGQKPKAAAPSKHEEPAPVARPAAPAPAAETPAAPGETPKKTDTPAFKQWFGDSKVVDGDGKPLVVYHGTNVDISQFGGKGRRAITWVTPDPGLANQFVAGGRRNVGEKAKKGSSVYPLYASIKKPLDLRSVDLATMLPMAKVLEMAGIKATDEVLAQMAKNNLASGWATVSSSIPDHVGYLVNKYRNNSRLSDMLDNPELVRVLSEAGYDGLHLTESYSSGTKKDRQQHRPETYAVFNPSQVKSALGNSGAFDANSPMIAKSVLFFRK